MEIVTACPDLQMTDNRGKFLKSDKKYLKEKSPADLFHINKLQPKNWSGLRENLENTRSVSSKRVAYNSWLEFIIPLNCRFPDITLRWTLCSLASLLLLPFGMVISILTVWECDENTFQSSKSIFLGSRDFSLKFERSENFKESPSCPEKCFYKTENDSHQIILCI